MAVDNRQSKRLKRAKVKNWNGAQALRGLIAPLVDAGQSRRAIALLLMTLDIALNVDRSGTTQQLDE